MRPRRDRLTLLPGVVAFGLPLLLYLITLAPTVTLEDSGEFITVAHHLGVAHPSGYPLWALVAHAFTQLPLGSVAQRVHLCSAFFAALTCWVTYLAARRLALRPVAACAAALALGASSVLWSQAVVAEVYTLNGFLTVLCFYWVLRWQQSRERRWLYLLALSLGLGLGNHQLLLLAALPLLAWLVVIDWRGLLEPRALLGATLLLVLGLSVYFYLPLRAASAPPINIGNPDSLEKTLAHIRRDVYQTEKERDRWGGGARDVALHSVEAWAGSARALGLPLAVLAAAGAVVLARRRPGVLGVTLAIALLNTVVLNALLQPRFNPQWVFVHRVYYIPTHIALALWLAVAIDSALARLAGRRRARAVLAVALSAALIWETAGHYSRADRSGDQRARDFAMDLLDSAPEGAGFIAIDDEVVFPLAYMKWVEGVRPDVHILSEELGWKGEPVSAILVTQPLSEPMFEEDPDLAQYASVPTGMGYRLVPKQQAPAPTDRSFVPLPGPPRDGSLESFESDVFADFVKARYAAYHARLGAKRRAEGGLLEAQREFARAERLNPDDPFVTVLLVDIYRRYGLHRERWIPMLGEALVGYDTGLDPLLHRYYPLRREDIEKRLEELGGPSASP